jgi:HAD superfamily hydrolase (TIGR01490 family)
MATREASMSRYLVFYDLDRTILNNSSGRLFIKYSYDRNLVSHRELLYGLYASFMHRLGFLDAEKILRKLVQKYKGLPEQRLLSFSRDFFSDVVVHHIRKGAPDEIRYHRERSAKNVMLSASMSFICDPVKEFLGLDDVLCTSLEVHNGFLTGRISGAYCYGMEKLRRAVSYCREENVPLESAYYYADARADLPVLSAVGNPVCVSPDRFLRNHALKRGWPVRNW